MSIVTVRSCHLFTSVQDSTHRFTSPGSFRQGHLQFRENSSLRSVVLRTPFSNLFGLSTALGLTSLSTITSLALSEFALELAGPPFEFTEPSINLWGNWDEIDKLFNSFLDRCPDFKLVIRRSRISDRDEFQAQAKERFPLMAERNCIQFEMSSAVDEYWGKCSPPHSVCTHKLIRSFEPHTSRRWEALSSSNIHGYTELSGKNWQPVQITENGECYTLKEYILECDADVVGWETKQEPGCRPSSRPKSRSFSRPSS